MAAVQDQRKRCERWKEKFSKVNTVQYRIKNYRMGIVSINPFLALFVDNKLHFLHG